MQARGIDRVNLYPLVQGSQCTSGPTHWLLSKISWSPRHHDTLVVIGLCRHPVNFQLLLSACKLTAAVSRHRRGSTSAAARGQLSRAGSAAGCSEPWTRDNISTSKALITLDITNVLLPRMTCHLLLGFSVSAVALICGLFMTWRTILLSCIFWHLTSTIIFCENVAPIRCQ